MEAIAIYGAGGFGRETAWMIEQINQAVPSFVIRGFFDDGLQKGEAVDGYPVLGGLEDLNTHGEALALAVAVADPSIRMQLVEGISNSGIYFPVLVHPQANIGSALNHFGRGTIITAGCVLTTSVVLGEFVIVNLNCTLGHDVKVGSYCSVMPGCHLSGHVQIGEGTLVGTGANILQHLTIGRNCKIGAGTVVTKSFSDNKTIVGVPGRSIHS